MNGVATGCVDWFFSGVLSRREERDLPYYGAEALIGIICGLPGALSAITKFANEPGVKPTRIAQLSPGGRVSGHAWCTDALPETDTWIFSSGAGLGLLNVKYACDLRAGISEPGPAAWWAAGKIAATGVLRKTARFPASE